MKPNPGSPRVDSPSGFAGRRARWVTLAGLLTLASLARLPGLAGAPLWIDERFTLSLARLPLTELIGTGASLHPPGYPLLARFALWVGGEDWAVRLPALAGGVVAIAAVWALVNEHGRPRLAFWTAAVSAFSVYSIYYSQEARGYSWMCASIGWASVFGCRALRDPSPRWVAGAILAGSAAVGFHYLALPSTLAIVGVLGFARFSRGIQAARAKSVEHSALRWIVVAVVLVVLASAAWLFRHRIALLVAVLDRPATTAVQIGPRLVAETLGRWVGLGPALGYLCIGLLLAGTLGRSRATRPMVTLVFLAFAGPFVLFAFLPWPLKFEARYLMAGWVPGLSLVGLGVQEVLLRASRVSGPRPALEWSLPLPFAVALAFQVPVLLQWWRQPIRMLQAEDTRPFGARYLTLQSHLNPWVLRSLEVSDLETTGWRFGPLELPLPDWTLEPHRTRIVGPSAFARWTNPLTDESLDLMLTWSHPGAEREATLPRRSEGLRAAGNCFGRVRARYRVETGERIGSTDLLGRCEDCGLRFVLRARSARLEQVDVLLREVATSTRCLAETAVDRR